MLLQSMYLGFSVVFPLLCYMALGWLIKRKKWASPNTFEEMNKLVFRTFMAALLFYNTYSIDAASIFTVEHLKLLLFSLLCLAAVFLAAELGTRRMVRDRKRAAVISQGIFRSNLALFGLPISIAVYGEGRQGDLAVLMGIIVPLYNILAEIVLSRAEDRKPSLRTLLKKIFHNPLVDATFLGIALILLGIKLPIMVEHTIERLGKVTTPLAFVIIGGSLAIKDFHQDRKAITAVSLVRLLLLPAVILPVAYLLGMRGSTLICLLVVFASPIAVSSYTMARDKNIAPSLAGGLVAATTFASVLTIFLWITLLSSLNLL